MRTLVSQNGIFELGFFVPGTSHNIYLGIWYRNFGNNAIVWVANRESPSNNPASLKLELLSDGNLVLLKNFTETVWSTTLASSMPHTTKAEAVILDDGNFVIRDGSNPSTIYWQSFDYPTDTWLPGAKLGINKHTGQKICTSFHGIDPNGNRQFFIEWNRSHRYWSTGDWNGQTFGLVQQIGWLEGPWSWILFWAQPKDKAGVYGLCGVFGVFHENSSSYCECLKGFKPLVQDEWSSGCVRKSPLQCQNMSSVGKEDGFLKMSILNYVSERDLINLQQSGAADGRAGAEIYIRLAASEPELQIGNGSTRTGKEYTGHDILLFDFDTNPGPTNNESSSVDNRKKRWSKNMELPLFSYESVSVATGQFSDKLGEGGFGPVYKGKLPTGLEVAVKRLSERSGQGLEEFRNETILIAKLQHRNLVRLLGSCIERDEKMLIYEYMPNKSLDFFLFDLCINYKQDRTNLRLGYTDSDNRRNSSRPSLNISDFGMARIFGGKETQGNTNRIVGTYGYMSPEYAMEGLFSVKSDVFSFGVLVLEIVSGRKNTSFYHSDSLNLLGHAWKLWNSNKASDLMDPTLGDPPSTSMLPADRPTMSDVISMIVNENVALPDPKQPAFVAGRNVAEQGSLMSSAGVPSVNNVTITAIDAR
uniref:Receptor-like serine/threonine-protein kinase n=1 Tax=Salix viminalis TaxID=40686 RepID=A0A6N2M2T6_SALVM